MGELDGYGRIFDVPTPDEDKEQKATVTVGFFTEGKLDGKGEVYDIEGNVSPGIWKDHNIRKVVGIHNYLTRHPVDMRELDGAMDVK